MPTAELTAQRSRKLRDLAGIGPSIEQNLIALGVSSVAELSLQDGDDLYRKLCILENAKQDPCVLDTFRCAVAQARNPHLPADQCNWWWWSRERIAGQLPSSR